MSDEEGRRWDRRWADGGYTPRQHPSPFLVSWLDRIPRGRALDLATGTGRNALHLASAGFDVTAVDVSAVAVDRARAAARERELEVTFRVADLDDADLGGPWDLVTVVRYRNEALWPRIVAALAPDGWVVVEHHLRTHLDVAGPDDDAFRLAPGELLAAFGGLRVVHYEEVVEPSDHPAVPDARFASARLVAVNGSPGF